MNKRLKYSLVVIGALVVLGILLQIPLWRMDAKARRERQEVLSLIAVGQDLSAAEAILEQNGYSLMYADPIKPTYDERYLSQIVQIGPSESVGLEALAYAIDASWMPYTRSEPSYVVLKADLDGVLTSID